jgi:hypothetical protein
VEFLDDPYPHKSQNFFRKHYSSGDTEYGFYEKPRLCKGGHAKTLVTIPQGISKKHNKLYGTKIFFAQKHFF